jgi:hypothetical protein
MPNCFDNQPFFRDPLKRSPANRCFICGEKMVVSPTFRGRYVFVGDRIIGYAHRRCEFDDGEEDELQHETS